MGSSRPAYSRRALVITLLLIVGLVALDYWASLP